MSLRITEILLQKLEDVVPSNESMRKLEHAAATPPGKHNDTEMDRMIRILQTRARSAFFEHPYATNFKPPLIVLFES